MAFDAASFRAQIPAYSNPIDYPDAYIESFWDAAVYYVSPVGNYGALQGEARRYALNLMTAHLIYLSQLMSGSSPKIPYILQSSAIDKVQITTVLVPVKNEWSWWLGTSGYGLQLLALLRVKSVGGSYIGGSPQVSAFRR